LNGREVGCLVDGDLRPVEIDHALERGIPGVCNVPGEPPVVEQAAALLSLASRMTSISSGWASRAAKPEDEYHLPSAAVADEIACIFVESLPCCDERDWTISLRQTKRVGSCEIESSLSDGMRSPSQESILPLFDRGLTFRPDM